MIVLIYNALEITPQNAAAVFVLAKLIRVSFSFSLHVSMIRMRCSVPVERWGSSVFFKSVGCNLLPRHKITFSALS